MKVSEILAALDELVMAGRNYTDDQARIVNALRAELTAPCEQ